MWRSSVCEPRDFRGHHGSPSECLAALLLSLALAWYQAVVCRAHLCPIPLQRLDIQSFHPAIPGALLSGKPSSIASEHTNPDKLAMCYDDLWWPIDLPSMSDQKWSASIFGSFSKITGTKMTLQQAGPEPSLKTTSPFGLQKIMLGNIAITRLPTQVVCLCTISSNESLAILCASPNLSIPLCHPQIHQTALWHWFWRWVQHNLTYQALQKSVSYPSMSYFMW